MGVTIPTTRGLGSLRETFDRDPTEYYDAIRELGPVVWDEDEEVWLVAGYRALRELTLADKVAWVDPIFRGACDPRFRAFGVPIDQWLTYTGGPTVLQQTENEVHSRQHRWWMRALSPKVLKRWGDEIVDPIYGQALAELAPRGKADLSAEFLQFAVLKAQFSVLGVPTDDEWIARFSELAPRLLAIFGSKMLHLDPARNSAEDEDVLMSLEASGALREMVAEVARGKRQALMTSSEADAAGIDFIGLLWSGGEDLFVSGEPTVQDVVGHAWMGIAGVESAVGGAQSLSYLLAKHPELHDRIRDDERAADAFVEETTRLYGANEFRFRRALRDIELAGIPIKEGQMAVALIASANRDPEHYSNAAEIDLDRTAPRDHFGFFQGPRSCVGMSIARLHLQRLVRKMLEHLGELRLDIDAPPPRYRGSQLRHWDPLHVIFTDRKAQ